MKLTNYFSGLLNENEDFLQSDSHAIGKIKDVNFNKEDDYIKIDFQTVYGTDSNLVVKYSEFKKWFIKNINKHTQIFKAFAEDFLKNSQESMNEIVDDEGNLMASTDKPMNSTNNHVGINNTWDLDKVYKSNVPKSMKFYNGYYGSGIVTW